MTVLSACNRIYEMISLAIPNDTIKAMRKHGSPKIITTDKLPSYGAAFHEIGVANKQLCGYRSNNRCENSHLPFRRRERAMQRFKTVAAL